MNCSTPQWHPTPLLVPGKSHGRRSLVGCSPWSLEESDTTERLHFHFSLSCFGEGNGNPLQCSCLENPMDGGAWWAAVYGVAQSRPRLKRLSSSPLCLSPTPGVHSTYVHRVSDAIQPSHPLSSPSPAPNPSQPQGLFQRVNSSHEVAKVLEFQL